MKAFRFLLPLLLLLACQPNDESIVADDFFFLRNDGADMPVWVRGNSLSEAVIIVLHGGPGGTSQLSVGIEAYELLEDDYLMVHWDQRASGSSQGNSQPEQFNMAQFVEDTDQLVELIRWRYENRSIFLMGHSWGGGLGTDYLLDSTRQAKIAGWIEIDGSHNNVLGDSLSIAWVRARAQDSVALNQNADYWQFSLDWYEAHPIVYTSDMAHYTFVRDAGGYYYDKSNALPYSSEKIFHSPMSLAAAFNAIYALENFEISQFDYTDRMHQITLPSLIIWGEHDGIIPLPLAQDAYDALGTANNQKSIELFEFSAHSPMREEAGKFAHVVKKFVENYK